MASRRWRPSLVVEQKRFRFFSPDALWSTSLERWPSLHLRRYEHDAVVEEFETPAAVDQILVLVVSGSTLIESRRSAHWRSSAHVPGNIGLTEPGEVDRLRWRGPERHQTLHLHLPASTMAAAAADVADGASGRRGGATGLAGQDLVIASVMRSLARAAEEGAPDVLAASAAHFLARHLLLGDRRTDAVPQQSREAARLRRVEDFMTAHLASDVSLQDLADAGGCTTFQLIRFCKAHWGETPFRRLTRLRMEAAQNLLRRSGAGVISVALDCGYSNPSHFAIAFRRATGMSPSEYRSR